MYCTYTRRKFVTRSVSAIYTFCEIVRPQLKSLLPIFVLLLTSGACKIGQASSTPSYWITPQDQRASMATMKTEEAMIKRVVYFVGS